MAVALRINGGKSSRLMTARRVFQCITYCDTLGILNPLEFLLISAYGVGKEGRHQGIHHDKSGVDTRYDFFIPIIYEFNGLF